MANEAVAPDLSDHDTIGGKLWWLMTAFLRIGFAIFVVVTFMCLLITVTTRYQADAALVQQKRAALGLEQSAQNLTTQQIIDEFGGIGASDASDDSKVALAGDLAKLNAEVESAAALVVRQQAWLDSTGDSLRRLTARACGSQLNLDAGVEPLAASLKADACLTSPSAVDQVGDANAVMLLKSDLDDSRGEYNKAHAQVRSATAKLIAAREKANDETYAPVAALAKASSSLNTKAQLEALVPPQTTWILDRMFKAPLLISSAALVFIGGMLGALVIQLVLICFPGYLPLTIGSGGYFFLRVPMGGMVAVLAMLALQSGITITGLTDLTQTVGSIAVPDPAKLAFLGVAAGAFADQIGKAVVGYVSRLVPLGGDTVAVAPPPAPVTTAPATYASASYTPSAGEGIGMGPGAADEHSR
jgi:hypothetical protein